MKSDNITITDGRVKSALYIPFKEFLDNEKISEQITKNIEEHSIKKGKVLEVYHYLDKSLVKLSDGTEVEAWHLHRCFGNIVDLFTPEGEQIFSEKKKEPCIFPKFDLKCLVAEVGKSEYVLLGYYNPNMVGAYSPADKGSYLVKTLTDTSQGGLKVSPQDIKLTSNNGVSFKEQDMGKSTEINYANSKDIYNKKDVDTKFSNYKKEVDLALKEIWDYILDEGDVDSAEDNN